MRLYRQLNYSVHCAREAFLYFTKNENTALRSARYENTLRPPVYLTRLDSRYHFSGPIEFYEHTTGWWNFLLSIFAQLFRFMSRGNKFIDVHEKN